MVFESMVIMWDENWVFEGDETALKNHLKSIFCYYVYALCRPTGEPFYIGKGKGSRALHHVGEAKQGPRLFQQNPHKNNIIRKMRRSGDVVHYKLAGIFDDENESLDFEHSLIEHYKRFCDGGCLSNLDPGRGSARGPAPLSRARHGATLSGSPKGNPERATLNRFLQSIGGVESVPIKPLSQINLQHSVPHPQNRRPTKRSAYALIASASAHELMLQAGVTIPRRFIFEGVEGVLENGVCRDILKANMARLEPANHPRDERFILGARQIETVQELYGFERLSDFGLLGS